MNKTYKYGSTTTVDKETMDKLLCKGSKPQTTEITMQVSDIKTITDEDLKTERPKEEYDKTIMKTCSFLKGLLCTNALYREYIEELIDELESYE